MSQLTVLQAIKVAGEATTEQLLRVDWDARTRLRHLVRQGYVEAAGQGVWRLTAFARGATPIVVPFELTGAGLRIAVPA